LLLADLTVEGGVGELASVEDLAGAFRVDSMVGDPLGNDGGDAEDRVAICEVGYGEAAIGEDHNGHGIDAVSDAKVLTLNGGVFAAGVRVDVLEALVKIERALLVRCGVVHGYPLPPGLWKTCGLKQDGPATGGRAFCCICSLKLIVAVGA